MTVTAEESLGTIDSAPAAADSIATPGAIPYQAVADHELERFGTHLPPIPVVVAGAFIGVFLATSIHAVRAIVVMSSEGFGIASLLYVIVNALALGVAVTSGIFAYRARTDVARTILAIRQRPRISLRQVDEEPIYS